MVLLPVISIAHSAIKYDVYFASDNIMRPWHLSYMLINILMILLFFVVIRDSFLPAVRDSLVNGFDKDSWKEHLDAILHFVKQEEDPTFDEEEDIEVEPDYDETTCLGKMLKCLIGAPVEVYKRKQVMTDVTESAAIYRIVRSYERDKIISKDPPMCTENWFAKSDNWETPTEEFLCNAYW